MPARLSRRVVGDLRERGGSQPYNHRDREGSNTENRKHGKQLGHCLFEVIRPDGGCRAGGAMPLLSLIQEIDRRPFAPIDR